MLKRIAGPAVILSLSTLAMTSCEDEVSPIGSSIFNGDVAISVDSSALKFEAHTIEARAIDARSTSNLLGHLSVPEYGELSAAYVTQMLAASQLNIPDSIGVDRIDSIKLVMLAPRSGVIGDSLAPQQFKTYALTRQLPSDITSSFNPDGYYDPSKAVASRNYTLSAIALGDSLLTKLVTLPITTPLPKQWAIDIFNAYRTDPGAFAWPSTFNQYFPGLYIEPSFGRGAMANISSTQLRLYYHYYTERNVVEDEVSVKKQVTMKDSTTMMASAPEVLSSTIFKYTPSQNILNMVAAGKKVVTAPLGYHVGFTFPIEDILAEYWASDVNLLVINNMTLALPAVNIENDYGITPPPTLLLILDKDIDDFFANGKVPDNKTSFLGTYSSTRGRYEFSSMREYIVDLKNKKGSITEDDVKFTLIPVLTQSETVSNSYTGTSTTYVTSCTPYLERPAMAELKTDEALVVFTFTSQLMK